MAVGTQSSERAIQRRNGSPTALLHVRYRPDCVDRSRYEDGRTASTPEEGRATRWGMNYWRPRAARACRVRSTSGRAPMAAKWLAALASCARAASGLSERGLGLAGDSLAQRRIEQVAVALAQFEALLGQRERLGPGQRATAPPRPASRALARAAPACLPAGPWRSLAAVTPRRPRRRPGAPLAGPDTPGRRTRESRCPPRAPSRSPAARARAPCASRRACGRRPTGSLRPRPAPRGPECSRWSRVPSVIISSARSNSPI